MAALPNGVLSGAGGLTDGNISTASTVADIVPLVKELYLGRNQNRVVGATARPPAADLKYAADEKRQLRFQISAVFSALHIDICSDHAEQAR